MPWKSYIFGGSFATWGSITGNLEDQTDLNNRFLTVETQWRYYEIFDSESTVSGSVTVPTNAEILLGRYTDGIDALCVVLDSNGRPTDEAARETDGTVVTVDAFDTSGNYTLSGTPDPTPFGIVYQIRIQHQYSNNVDPNSIIVAWQYEGVEVENNTGLLFVRGKDGVADSHRWSVTSDNKMQPERYNLDTWIRGELELSPSTLFLGKNLALSAAGDFFLSEDTDGTNRVLYAFSSLDDDTGSEELRVPYLDALIPREIFQPDDSGEIVGTTIDVLIPVVDNQLISSAYVRVGSVEATAPVDITAYRGTSDTDPVIWNERIPAFYFTRNSGAVTSVSNNGGVARFYFTPPTDPEILEITRYQLYTGKPIEFSGFTEPSYNAVSDIVAFDVDAGWIETSITYIVNETGTFTPDETRIDLRGLIRVNAGETNLIRLESDNTISLKADATNTVIWYADDSYNYYFDEVLITKEWTEGDPRTAGEWYISHDDRKIYVATSTGTKGATFSGERDTDWSKLASENYVDQSVGGFTEGSIPFAGGLGTLTEDNTNLFWNDTDNTLGIGTQGINSAKLAILQNGDLPGIFIDMNGNGRGVWIGGDGHTTSELINVTSSTTTSGILGNFYCSSPDASRFLTNIQMDNFSATAVCSRIINNGTGIAQTITANNNSYALDIYTPGNTTSNGFTVHGNNHTTGGLCYHYSTSPDTSNRKLFTIFNSSPLATGATVMSVQQYADQTALDVSIAGVETTNGVWITGTGALTTGRAFNVFSNSDGGGYTLGSFEIGGSGVAGSNAVRAVHSGEGNALLTIGKINETANSTTSTHHILNGNTVTTGDILNISGAGLTTGNALYIDVATSSTAMNITGEAKFYSNSTNEDHFLVDGNTITQANVFSVVSNSLTTGRLAHFYSSIHDGSTRELVNIHNDNPNSVGTTCLNIEQDANNRALYLDANGVTSNSALKIDANSLTSGSAIDITAFPTDGTAKSLVKIINESLSMPNISCLELKNNSTGGDGSALLISEGAVNHYNYSSSQFIHQIAGINLTNGTVMRLQADSLTTGQILRVESDSADINSRKLVEIINDNSLAVGTTGLYIQQDSTGYALDVLGKTNIVGNTTIDGTGIGTSPVLTVTGNDLSTGSIANFSSNSDSTAGRNLVNISNDNSLAVNTTVLYITQNADNEAMSVVSNGNGLNITSTGLGLSVNSSSNYGIDVTASTAINASGQVWVEDIASTGYHRLRRKNGTDGIDWTNQSAVSVTNNAVTIYSHTGDGLDNITGTKSIACDSDTIWGNRVTDDVNNIGFTYADSAYISTLDEWLPHKKYVDDQNLWEIGTNVLQPKTNYGLNITQDLEAYGVLITQNTDHSGLYVYAPGTQTSPAMTVTASNIENSVGLFYSDSAWNVGSRTILKVHQDNATADNCSALFVTQTSDKAAIDIDAPGTAIDMVGHMRYTGVATTQTGFDINGNTQTTGNVVDIYGSALTSGSLLRLHSNSTSNASRNLFEAINDNDLATGTSLAYLRQDAIGQALYIESAGTSLFAESTSTVLDVIDINSDTLTAGSLISATSNSESTTGRNLISLVNDNPLATGTTCMYIRQDSTGNALHAVGNALIEGTLNIDGLLDLDGRIDLDSTATSEQVISVVADSLTTGRALQIESNSPNTSTRFLTRIENKNSLADGTYVMYLTQAGDAPTIYTNSYGNQTSDIIDVIGNNLTTGSLAVFRSNSDSTSARQLVQILNEDTLATTTTPLFVRNYASGRPAAELVALNGRPLSVNTYSATQNGINFTNFTTDDHWQFVFDHSTGLTSTFRINYQDSDDEYNNILYLVATNDGHGYLQLGNASDDCDIHTYGEEVRLENNYIASTNSIVMQVKGAHDSTNYRYAELGVRYSNQSGSGGSDACTAYLHLQPGDGGSTGSYLWVDNSDNLRIGSLGQVGSTSGTVVGTQSSDIRVKNVTRNCPYGLNEILKINPIQFTYKYDTTNRSHVGFSAQEVEYIVSEAVYDTGHHIDDSGVPKKAMDYTELIPVLVNAIKEQQKIIEQLQNNVRDIQTV